MRVGLSMIKLPVGKAAATAAAFLAVVALALGPRLAAGQTEPVFVDSIAVEGNERLASAVLLTMETELSILPDD